ncbi:CBS domain-containing protein [Aquibacillus koreensis]|uniref:CBS domain-containing protein n=1 Tax=Aquibacillus koreensis TaxID=279446 RepID=A0A9X3WKC7_9BACI|nr:CBS domain-containing protein [Aquibacillus koreensis]MCT2536354.1 CBS domain-containing protein [Aquibacillus koreensis]MDC3421295.1 CBS domain-containing protein [Aquibacillus koreensis]
MKYYKSEKVERFEAAFNRIHKKLTALSKEKSDYISYGDILHLSRKTHNVVRNNYDTLKQFGRLRNAIVHRKIREDYYIAEPHEDIVKEIEKLSELIHEPPLALSIASQPVISFSPSTSLNVILEVIREKGYSQFPIYDETGFKGLLTAGGISKWLSYQLADQSISLKELTAADILQHEKDHNVAILNRKSSIYDLEAVFEDCFDKNMKLEAIIITQTGAKNQKPIGIVTSWDLVQIDHTTLSIASHV